MPTVPGTGTTGSDLNLIGDKNKNILTGNAGNDFLDGKGASDALSGGAGNDILIYDPLDSKIDGGAGFDTLQFLTDQRLNLTGNKVVIQIEEFKLSTNGRNTLSFTSADVIRVSDTDKFRLWGDSTDRIIFNDSGWSFNGFTSTGLVQFKNGGAGIEAQIGLRIDGFSNNAQINFASDADKVVVEDESATTLSAIGSIVVNDPNAQNFLTTQITPAGGYLMQDMEVGSNLGELSLGALTVGGLPIPGVSNGSYEFTVANASTQFLAEDEEWKDEFTVTSIDGTIQTLSFTLVGVNDAPERTDSASQSANVTEIADNTVNENNFTNTRTGSFVITDVDRADELFFWVESPTGNHGTLTVGPISDPDETGGRTIIWTYVVNDADLDTLRDAAFIEHNTIHISDRPEGSDAATVIDVDLQVNLQGANDAVEVRPLRTAVDVITRTMYESPSTIGSITNETLEFQFQARDVDLLDEFTVSPTGTTSSTSPIGSLGNGRSVNYDPATGTRDVLYTFQWQDSELDYLAHNQTLDQQFQVTVSDALTSANQTITVRFVGTNDAPVRTDSATQLAEVTEIADGATGENTASSTRTGSFVITDVDLADSLHSWVEPPTGSRGTLTVNANSPVDPETGERTVNWTYVVSDGSLDSLGEDLFDQRWTIHISDREQNTTNATVIDVEVIVNLQGANDAPELRSIPSQVSFNEIVDQSPVENSYMHTVLGTFIVRDVDQIDTLSRWIINPSSPRGTLSVTLISAPDANGDRAVSWTYVVADSALDSLRSMQSIVEIYHIMVSDRAGGTGSTVLDMPITITLNGANDAPTRFGSGGVTGAVTELASNHANANSGTYLHTATGSFQVKDVDIGDTLVQQSIVHSAQNNAKYGTLTINGIGTADLAGIRTVSWTYSVSDQDLNPLPAGGGPLQSFQITLADSNGATVTETVNITLTGAADGPAFGGDVLKTVSEFADGNILENYGVHTISGTVTATNMPTGSLLIEKVVSAGSLALGSFSATASAIDANGNATISWTYKVADCLLDFVDFSHVDGLRLKITHSSNSAITQQVSINIAGALDFTTSPEVTFVDAINNAVDYTTEGLPPGSIAALQVYGLDNDDTLRTDTNAIQTLFGGEGNDVFKLSSGTVFAVGGSGNDRVDFMGGTSTVWAWGQQGGDIFNITNADPNAKLWAMDFTLFEDHIAGAGTSDKYTLTMGTTSATNASAEGFNPNVVDGTPYYRLTGPNQSNVEIDLYIIGLELSNLNPAPLFA